MPFEVSFKGKEDRDLPTKLAGEREGILAWLVRGCLDWRRDGLNPPTEVLAAIEEYRAEMDPIGDFIVDRCVVDPRCSSKAGRLYEAFCDWFKTVAGGEPMTPHAFGKRLSALGYPAERTSQERRRRGIGLRVDRAEGDL